MIRRLPSSTEHLVEGLIPPRSVNLLVGDSGVGKSALAYQLGLAVATGVPFLDLPVRRGRVLFVDYENSLADAHWIMKQQRQHLGLASFPHTFQLWPMHLDPLQDKVEDVIASFRPDFVILDSLRSFNPRMEGDNTTATEQIKSLRLTAAESGTAFLLVHHVSKQRQRNQGRANLEQAEIMDWLLRSSGARAVINQTDVRLAVARRGRSDEAALILRGHFRTRGEVGPFLLRRKRAEGGAPLGYERVAVNGALLENTEQEAFFARLPEAFSFKEARLLSGKSHGPVHLLLRRMMGLGLVHRAARGQYCKGGVGGMRHDFAINIMTATG